MRSGHSTHRDLMRCFLIGISSPRLRQATSTSDQRPRLPVLDNGGRNLNMWLIFLKNMKVADELMKIAVVASAAGLVRGSAWTERTRGDSWMRKLSSNETASAKILCC